MLIIVVLFFEFVKTIIQFQNTKNSKNKRENTTEGHHKANKNTTESNLSIVFTQSDCGN